MNVKGAGAIQPLKVLASPSLGCRGVGGGGQWGVGRRMLTEVGDEPGHKAVGDRRQQR